jgi:hypothetical protein
MGGKYARGSTIDLIGNKRGKMPSKAYAVSISLDFRPLLKALLYRAFTISD